MTKEDSRGIIRDNSPEHIDRPVFNSEKVVDWNCPCCGEAGYDNPRTADYYPTCSNTSCPVQMFTVFREAVNE